MPSEMAMVMNSIGNPPASRTPSLARLASRSSDRLQGVTSFQLEATPIWAFPQSASVIPTARSMARAGARSIPSVTSWLRGFIASGITGAYSTVDALMAGLLIGTESGILGSGIDAEVRPVRAITDGWAIVDRSVLVERNDAGEWIERLAWPQSLTALTAAGGDVFLGTSTGDVARFDGSARPVPGFDRVKGRDQWHAVGSSKPYVRSMSTSVDGVIFANVHVGGIPRSTDDGTTW